MNTDVQTVTLLCCGVLAAEIKSMHSVRWPQTRLRVLDSMLHMKPENLAQRLAGIVDEEQSQARNVLLVYGDCCGLMAGLEARPGVARTRCNNCCELVLGRQEYRRLSHEGAFFLFPEWTRRWHHVFTTELGLNSANAAGLMRDMHRKLVYLDTGVAPVPSDALEACARHCGLPFEVRPVALDFLRDAVQEAMDRLAPQIPPT